MDQRQRRRKKGSTTKAHKKGKIGRRGREGVLQACWITREMLRGAILSLKKGKKAMKGIEKN